MNSIFNRNTTTTTTTQNNILGGGPATANAYYDKPADRRLRPWIILGSLILMAIGAGMIITPLVHVGHLGTVWGIFVAGIALAAAGLLGLLAGFTLRPFFAGLFFFALTIAFLGSLAVLIINACFLNGNMNNQCAASGAARFSQGCENIRDYHTILFCVFGPLVGLFVPTLWVAAAYLYRTTSLYRKQEFDAYANQAGPVPVGSSRM